MLHRITHRPQAPALSPARAAEAQENAASIRAIPLSELPDGPARDALIALAEAGHEVDAYRPLGSPTHVLWLRPQYPWQDGRLTPAEWIARYEDAHAASDQVDAHDQVDADRQSDASSDRQSDRREGGR